MLIAIIAVLIALLLPAVQQAREGGTTNAVQEQSQRVRLPLVPSRLAGQRALTETPIVELLDDDDVYS